MPHHEVMILLVTPCLLTYTALQYHARPKAKCGIAMLSVDKFLYPRKQTKGNKFIPCPNDVCHILKCFRRFETPAIPFILPKSSYKLSVAWSQRSGKECERWPWSMCDCHCDIINDVPFSLYVMLMMSNVKYVSIFHGYLPLRNESQHRAWDKVLSALMAQNFNVFFSVTPNRLLIKPWRFQLFDIAQLSSWCCITVMPPEIHT